MVRLQLVPVASSADALKIFPAIWVPGPEFPDEPGRHDVINVATSAGHPEIHPARGYFAMPVQCRLSVFVPSTPLRCPSGPFAIDTFPANSLFLCPETSSTEGTTSVAIGSGVTMNDFEDVSSFVSTIGTMHGYEPLL